MHSCLGHTLDDFINLVICIEMCKNRNYYNNCLILRLKVIPTHHP
eukprot:XP_001707217.1 Hypothetical protein GL50803_8792 [Giardia lamblia ATCC 50803]